MRRFLLLIVCGAVVGGRSSRASNPTAPVGYAIVSLPATGEAATTAYLGVPLSRRSVFSGTVAAAGAATLTVDATSGWTGGQFTAAPYYVHVTSGAQAGRALAILANTATTLTLDLTDGSAQSTAVDAPGFALAAGDAFEIVPSLTLGSLFSGVADQVGLWSLRLGAYETYSFDPQSGRWTKDDASATDDYAGVPVPPGTAVALVRRPGRAAAQWSLSGYPAVVAPLVKLVGGGAVQYVGVPLPVDIVLADLNLGANWRRKSSPGKADMLSLYKSSVGKWKGYYQRKDTHWLRTDGLIKDSVSVPSGSAAGLTKRQPVSGIASYLQVSLPYSP